MKINQQLIDAFEDLNLAAMEYSINNGADVNCSHPDGGSLLSVAVDSAIDSNIQAGGSPGEEGLEYITLLLKNGADINLKLYNHSSALECAKAYSHATNVVIYLESFNS